MSGWREEARQDRLTRAQIDRDREAARAQARIAERRAAAQDRRDDQAARAAARQQARKARSARRSAMARWVRSHVMDLLFVPVIAVPAVLAWTAMAAFGYQIYGPAGLALPAFSEGSMWAFAAAVTITRRRHPGKPVWHLRLGTWVFAGAAAAMNFAHGLTAGPGLRGPTVGAVMAMVSVAGVTAHQLVTAGPRRSRAERDQARIARAAARREMGARRAAVRHAATELDEHGQARLVYAPGLAAASRRRRRDRPQAIAPGGPTCPWPGPAPILPVPATAPVRAPASAPGRTRTRTPTRTPSAPRNRTRVSDADAEMHFATDLAANEVPSARRIQKELHVGQDRASALREHLKTLTSART